MSNKIIHRAPVSSFMRQISLSILMPFFRKADVAPAHFPKFVSSAFSRPDESELLAHETEICPLVEAEVYAIFGRIADANEALSAGVKSGRITADQVSAFWAEQNNSKSGTAPF